jgi:hypothetical protein
MTVRIVLIGELWDTKTYIELGSTSKNLYELSKCNAKFFLPIHLAR